MNSSRAYACNALKTYYISLVETILPFIYPLKVVLVEGEAGEVAGVGVDQVLGDGVKFGHARYLGLRVGWFPQHGQESCQGDGSEGRRGIGGDGV